MPLRQIILDTETTGLNPEEGHRIIEIGCLEMVNRKLTGQSLHLYINPEREVEAGALAVHGLTNVFLQDKPIFSSISEQLINFIDGSDLIIHNAPFDVSFINREFILMGRKTKMVADYCRVIDTLQMARQLHAGQRNSLDALCKRYGVDNSKRELHGALLDAHLLAQVYLAMTGGQGSFFDNLTQNSTGNIKNTNTMAVTPLEKHQLVVLKASEQELTDHEKYLQMLKKQGKCLWN